MLDSITALGPALPAGDAAKSDSKNTAQIKGAAQQFESLMIAELLKSARPNGDSSSWLGAGEDDEVVRCEQFGPVIPIMPFVNENDAIERANNTPYGLSAGVWTDKGSKIFKIVNKLRAGVVWANTYNKFDPTSPFGGYKESGFGREGGVHGLGAYLALN